MKFTGRVHLFSTKKAYSPNTGREVNLNEKNPRKHTVSSSQRRHSLNSSTFGDKIGKEVLLQNQQQKPLGFQVKQNSSFNK